MALRIINGWGGVSAEDGLYVFVFMVVWVCHDQLNTCLDK